MSRYSYPESTDTTTESTYFPLSPQPHQSYINFQEITNFNFMDPNEAGIDGFNFTMESSKSLENGYFHQRLEDMDLQLQPDQYRNYFPGQLQPYDYYRQEEINYQGLRQTHSISSWRNPYDISQFRILEERAEPNHYASYSNLTFEQEYIYTPSPHHLQSNRTDYFDSSFNIYQSATEHSDSIPPPSEFEAHYEAQLLEYQKRVIQPANSKGSEKVTFQEQMILEEQMRWKQSDIVEEIDMHGVVGNSKILSDVKIATKKTKILHFEPVIRNKRSLKLNLKAPEINTSRYVPIIQVKKRAAANLKYRDGMHVQTRLSIPTVVIQAPSPLETSQISRFDNVTANSPVFITNPAISPSELLRLPKWKAPILRPRLVYPIRSIQSKIEENESDYDPDLSSDEKSEEKHQPSSVTNLSQPFKVRQLNAYQFVRIFGEQLEGILSTSSCNLSLASYGLYKHETFINSTRKQDLRLFVPKPSKARIAATDVRNGIENSYQSRNLKGGTSGTMKIKVGESLNEKKLRRTRLPFILKAAGTIESDGSSPLTEIEENDSEDDFKTKLDLEKGFDSS